MDLKGKKTSDVEDSGVEKKSASGSGGGKNKLVVVLVVLVLVVAAGVGAWYYKTSVLDKANDTDGTSKNADDSNKEKTDEEEIEEAITDSVEDLKKQAESDTSDEDTIHSSTTAAKQVGSGPDSDKAFSDLQEAADADQ